MLSREPLREGDFEADPLRQFQRWFAEARAGGVTHPETAVVATATPGGRPSARMVLVKQVDEQGFVFFTNLSSRKGRELAANPRAALLFYWEPSGRQVRIEGPVTPTSREQSRAYARNRPRGSQLSALASAQSEPVRSRVALEERVAELAAQHENEEIPLREDWGGVRMRPEHYEFWQDAADRLHDRLIYTPDNGTVSGWRIERLAP